MSVKLAEAHIEKIIKESAEYKNLGNIRQTLNKKIHSLDISFSSFEINNRLSINKLTTAGLKEAYELFVNIIKSHLNGRVFPSIDAANTLIEKEILKKSEFRCILIEGTNVFLIGYDYRAIRSLLSIVAKNDLIRKSPLGASDVFEDYESGVIATNKAGIPTKKALLELGHSGKDSPLAQKIKLLSSSSNNVFIKHMLDQSLSDLLTVQAKLGYKFLNKSDGSDFGDAVVNLVIQPRDVNKKFGEAETTIYRKVLNAVLLDLNLENVPGSNTVLQDAVQHLEDKVIGYLSNKKINSVKKHAPVSNDINLPKPKLKAASTSYKTSENASLIRPVSVPSYSLTSLQNLINTHLQDVISANMGSGNDPRILNYRTGRFAASARVERMSQSKAGMITAFYTYMKNPYQTFEPGFRQGSPKTRDPKLLIAGSIRDIAASTVGNRMRAVLI
jgi:hypothetical protein